MDKLKRALSGRDEDEEQGIVASVSQSLIILHFCRKEAGPVARCRWRCRWAMRWQTDWGRIAVDQEPVL